MNTAEMEVRLKLMLGKLSETTAQGYRGNVAALRIVGEIKDAVDLLEELGHREFGSVVKPVGMRRFRNKLGFQCTTDYVQVDPSGDTYLVSRNGFSSKTTAYDLQICLSFVKSGDWVELEAQ